MKENKTYRPETCEVCQKRLPIAPRGRPRLTCSRECARIKRRKRLYRPVQCRICSKPLAPAAQGRVRLTCSDRCRQIKRRRNYTTWIDPQHWKKAWRRAAREVRRMEKVVGPLDIPTPGYPYLTLARRVQIRLQRGDEIPFCHVCRRPYINDTPRRIPACQGQCSEKYMERQQALAAGLQKYAGKYDPRVDVRLRLGLPIKTCRQCGMPFPDYHPRRVYCSKKCCDAAWYARHPKRVCSECGTVYRGQRKTCSEACRMRRWRRTGIFCDRCHHAIKPGAEIRYEVSYNGPDPEPIRNRHGKLIPFQEAVFCSGQCRDALGWSPSRKVCKECNQAYYPKVKFWQQRQRYCSTQCAQRAYERQHPRRQSTPHSVTCRHCQTVFTYVLLRGRLPSYCSSSCRDEADRIRRRERRLARRQVGIPITLPDRMRVEVS